MQRLSGLDASFLYLESAWQPMNGCALWEMDTLTMPGGYTFDRLREGLSRHMKAMPRFREKLADSALNLDHPVWVDDDDFDIDRHLHRIELPQPGGRDELSEVCGHIAAQPLDRSRPLWEMWVIDGIGPTDPDQEGRLTLMLKVHHACMDAETGTDLLSRLCSTEADAPAPPPVDGVGSGSRTRIALSGLAGFASRPMHLAKVLVATVVWLCATLLPAAASSTRARPLFAPRTALNAGVTNRRNIAYAQLDLEDVKTVKNHFDMTVNDVVMALVSGVLRRFLLDHDQLPDPSLVALLPVSVHGQPGGSGRNQVSNRLVTLETGIADPAERLKAVAAANAVAKQSKSAIGGMLLQQWLRFVRPVVYHVAMGIYRATRLTERWPVHNVVVSNVPGPQIPLYFQSCRVLAQYPLGPVFPGSGVNITVMSLTGKLNIGITSCPDVLPDLWEMADDFVSVMKELLAAAESARRCG